MQPVIVSMIGDPWLWLGRLVVCIHLPYRWAVVRLFGQGAIVEMVTRPTTPILETIEGVDDVKNSFQPLLQSLGKPLAGETKDKSLEQDRKNGNHTDSIFGRCRQNRFRAALVVNHWKPHLFSRGLFDDTTGEWYKFSLIEKP